MAILLPTRSGLSYPAGFSPGFDPSHPAAKGISPGHGFSGIPIRTNFVNLLNAKRGNLGGTPAAVMDGVIGPAPYYGSGGTGDNCQFSGNSSVTDDDVTIAVILRPIAAVGVDSNYMATATTTGNGWSLCNTTSSVIRMRNWASIAGDGTSTIAIANNTPYFVAGSISMSRTTCNFVLLNLNTGQIQTQTVSPSNASSGASNGNYEVSGVAGGNGIANSRVAAVMFAPSFMSMLDLLKWADDPWAFWYPDNPLDDFLVASTLIPPSATPLQASLMPMMGVG